MDSLKRIELIARSPFWAILPDRLPVLLSFMVTGFASDWEAAKPSIRGKGGNKLAVIPVQGVLTKDGPAWLGSNYDSIAPAVEQAGADPDVKRVVLAVDSPGGEVTGLPETAAILAQVAKVKPVSAIVEGMAASAAYWLTSQAGNITVTPSGEVGSVGVRMMHMDISKMLDDAGIKVTEMHAGEFKTEWSPFAPVTDEAKADMQTRLNAVHQDFLTAVSTGRGRRATEGIQTARFGEGRMFSAADALGHGMVDKIQPPRDYYREVMPTQEEPKPTFGLQRARLDLERKRF